MTEYYPEPGGVTFPQLEEQVLRSWREQDILGKVRERMRGGEPLVFCEGPPTANSRPHIGHALTRAVKDAFLRYAIMNGRKIVPYIGGWDCHGLPVEIDVERSHGLRGKADIEALGVGRFNELCRESVVRHRSDWEDMSRRIGYWLDYSNAYLTMSNEYIESVWWSLKELHSKGLLRRGFQVLPYCPRCGTTLSTHEVALGFRDVEDRVVVVKFPVDGLDASILVYTATPWTLVANCLVAVDASQRYLMVEHDGGRLIVSEARAATAVPGAKVVSAIPGSDLVGRAYEPLFQYHTFQGTAFRIVHSSEVSRDEGTGALHIAPPYGSLDFEVGRANRVEIFDPVDDGGRFTSSVPELQGRAARDSDADVMRMVESKGRLFKWGLIKHSYPFCWRCDTALIYKPLGSWFVRTSQVKDRMVALNDEVRWVPGTFKTERFGSFLADVRDWAIGRSRYWGTPLPIWRCANGHEVCVGSIAELARLSVAPLPEHLDLHRPQVDGIVLRCPECSGTMARDEQVIDCWYDSGCAPFAQYHYPFENIEAFDGHRSVDFISESVDQTRGWFYTQHAISALLFDEPAFRSVLVMGHVLGEGGTRMGEHGGEVVYPDEVFSSVGADAVRLYLLGTPVWQSVTFSRETVRETMVGTLTTLINVYAFYASNSNAYGYTGQRTSRPTHDLDHWILSRLNSTVAECRSGFDAYEVHRAVRALESFIADLSTWYLRRSRRRFWEESDPQDRFSAHATLSECLMTLSRALAPVTPFFADWLYTSLKGPKASVHLEDYPVCDDDSVNRPLEEQIALVRSAVEAGRLARQKANVKLRQPLDKAVIAAGTDGAWVLRRYERMISEELNVKCVEVLESRESMVQFAVSPNLKALGPRLRGSADEVSQLLAKVDGDETVRMLRSKGRIRLGGFDLFEDDVIVSEVQKPGYSYASMGGVHVYIWLEVSQKLRLEGLSREVVRRVQQMRKDQGLRFEDPVAVEYSGHRAIETAVSSHRAYIMRETNAVTMEMRQPLDGARAWSVDRMPLELVVRKA